MEIINRTITALRLISTLRYFRTERGFVAEFYHQLTEQLKNSNLFPQHTILEIEVQKKQALHYGVTQRPDLLIHIPIETGLTKNANENNFVVYAFKLGGNPAEVKSDYNKLEQMLDRLNYELGVFINIGAYPKIYLDTYNGNYQARIHEISIIKQNEKLFIKHAYFNDGQLHIADK